MKKSLRRITIPIIAAAASLALATTPAFAYDNSMHTDDTDPGGVVYWTNNGDKLEVCDIEKDGYGVHVGISWSYNYDGPYTDAYYINQTAGNGTCGYRDAGDGGVYNIPEGTYVWVWIALKKGDKIDTDTRDDSVWLNPRLS
ncbi:hypothetical protein ACIRU8_36160 [Streptomyces sp. NPDC101175]|uniref:hypothetical protein n=1 Tax=Streptomyces sp. NPDC101175 TaxID=3366123 RepID=UPI0038324C71